MTWMYLLYFVDFLMISEIIKFFAGCKTFWEGAVRVQGAAAIEKLGLLLAAFIVFCSMQNLIEHLWR